MDEEMKALLEDLETTVDKRRYARFEIEIPAFVRQADGGRPVQAVARNISLDGIQLHCSVEDIKDLSSPSKPSAPTSCMNVDIGLRVPLKEGPAVLSARCKVCFVGKSDSGMVIFGMQFDRFYGDGEATKNAFLQQLLEPYLNCFEAYTQTWVGGKPS